MKKIYLFSFIILSVFTIQLFPSQVTRSQTSCNANSSCFFYDIQGHWATDDIQKLKDQCNVLGYQDAQGNLLYLFRPDIPITRAELITMVTRCKYGILPSVNKSPFWDVPITHWATQYIAKALEIGAVGGYADGTFKMNNYSTRAEALKMILMTWFNPDQINVPLEITCSDVQNSNWYAMYFNYALKHNIVSGYKNPDGSDSGRCGPNNNITRAEAAKMIIRTKGFINF